MLGGREPVGHIVIGGVKFLFPEDRLSVGEKRHRIVALNADSILVDVCGLLVGYVGG